MPEPDDRSEPEIPAMPDPAVDPAEAVTLIAAKVDRHATAVADVDAVVEECPWPLWRLHLRNTVRITTECSYALKALALELELEAERRGRR